MCAQLSDKPTVPSMSQMSECGRPLSAKTASKAQASYHSVSFKRLLSRLPNKMAFGPIPCCIFGKPAPKSSRFTVTVFQLRLDSFQGWENKVYDRGKVGGNSKCRPARFHWSPYQRMGKRRHNVQPLWYRHWDEVTMTHLHYVGRIRPPSVVPPCTWLKIVGNRDS